MGIKLSQFQISENKEFTTNRQSLLKGVSSKRKMKTGVSDTQERIMIKIIGNYIPI